MVDQAGLIRFVNPSALAALGYDAASDLLGEPRHQTIHYKRRDGTAFPAEQCPVVPQRSSGQMAHGDDWWVRRDGSMIPVEYWSVPIGMPGGEGAVVAFTDVSDRLAAEHAILEAALDGVISIDSQGRITYLNTAAERIFGYRADEVIGRELAETIVPPSLRDAHRAGLGQCLDTGGSRILGRRLELTGMRADGSQFPVELTVTRTGPPEAPAFTGYVRDITDRKRAAQDLMASRARLVTAFDAARQRITRDLHDGAQQRFVSTIISLQLAGQKWASDPHRARELVDLALDDAQRGLDELREIAIGMHPAILTQRGLTAALTALAGRLPVPVQLDLPGRRLPDAVEASVYFFCAEALTNVVKHACAGSAWVRVAADDERCTVEVRDDGIGGARAQSESSGLTGLRDRIGALNGSMDIASPAAAGTVLRARIPLPHDWAGDAGVVR